MPRKTFEDYMREGVLAAADAVKRETEADKVNVIGYCVGGTLLGTTLAYLAARGEEPFSSATFFAAQVDFTKAGDLLVFIDDAQLKALEEMMAERGYLDAGRMATVFNMLRPKDLIWPYVVNNYLLGKKPLPFDLLFWNQDSTRLPAANHKFYLRKFYQENRLARGQMTIGNVKLDLGEVKMPIYELVRQGGPHRPGQVGVHRLAPVRRPCHLRAGRLGPHRRRHQPADQDQIPVLDQRQARGHAGGLDGERRGASRLVVAALCPVARQILGQAGARARARRQARQPSRTHRAAT